MINCYFNADSYYIVGQGIEIYSTLINPEIDPIRRAYWAFILLLPELEAQRDNITFFNDSRLIDDMSGIVTVLDDWTREAKRISNQMLSSLYGIALFKKKEAGQLDKVLLGGRTRMLDPTAKQSLVNSMEQSFNKKHNKRVQKLRDSFFGGKNGY